MSTIQRGYKRFGLYKDYTGNYIKYLPPGYDALRYAIVLQAVKDHTNARDNYRRHKVYSVAKAVLDECEGFFRSDWFSILMPEFDGDLIIKTLNNTSVRKIKAQLINKKGGL